MAYTSIGNVPIKKNKLMNKTEWGIAEAMYTMERLVLDESMDGFS